MRFLDNLFKSSTITPNRQLINSIIANAGMVLEPEDKNKRGFLFELLLLSSIHVISSYNQKKPHNLQRFQNEYLFEIIQYAKENGIDKNINGDITDFVNDRLAFYHSEISHVFSGTGIIPTKLAYNLYEKSLEKTPDDCLDLPLIVQIPQRLRNLFQFINTKIHIVTNN